MTLWNVKKIALSSVFLLLLLAVLSLLGLGYCLTSPAKVEGEEQIFYVKEGAGLRQVARELLRSGLIRSERMFVLWARFMEWGRSLKAGEYELSPAMPPVRILDIMRRGATVMHSVTVPEGYSLRQIADLLEKSGLLRGEEFLARVEDPETIARYALPGPTLEGYLYPDTYRFARGQSAAVVIDLMVSRFREVTAPLMERITIVGLTLNEVITLASIVEKETGRAEERPVIASVFLNRLMKGMRLESDPTVIYGIRDFNGNLTREHLSRPTPYNTYRISGLPPGPIASPGLESIQAVLYPAGTDYLFFVSKNDGSHHFSRTYQEHQTAVELYQKSKQSLPQKSS